MDYRVVVSDTKVLDRETIEGILGDGTVETTAALHETIERGDLAGAGLDVRQTEPPGDSPLHGLDSVVLTSPAAVLSSARETAGSPARGPR